MGGMSIPQPGGSGRGRKNGRQRRRKKQGFGLQITSLMDVLMIIVIFLLKSYGLSSMSITNPDKMQLPISKSIEAFGEGIVITIARDAISIDQEQALQFKVDPNEASAVANADGTYPEGQGPKFELPEGAVNASDDRGILPIYDILHRKKEEFDTLASRQPNPEEAKKKWTGDLLVQADKNVNYDLLRQIMYTAGQAGYRQFRLTVEKQAE
ncbi:MAG: biopolymer transporter ExbD [Proteobacteria bacterium]|nr:MAG: biopolymer transporter ExbD [Pseudomonadota bacterium]